MRTDYPLPGQALPAEQYRGFSRHLAFHDQEEIPELLVDDEVPDHLALFYPQVSFGRSALGGSNATSPFSGEQIDEYARIYSRPEVLTGGFEPYRALDDDDRDNIEVSPTAVETMLISAEGAMESMPPTIEPMMTNITQAVEVPGSGHWLPEENPRFVVQRLREFLR